MGNHARLDANSLVRFLPNDIISNIATFIREPPKLWILSLDCNASTYVAIKQQELHRIFQQDKFLLGHNVEIIV